MILNYYKYYQEIKNRLTLVIFAWTFCLSVCYLHKEAILFMVIDSNNSFISLHSKPYFIFTNITEIFYVYLELSLFVANQIAIFMASYQTLMFLSLGLYIFEFLKIRLAFQVFVFSWLISIIFLSKIIIPLSWNFFLSFQENSNLIQPVSFFFEAKLMEYFHLFTSLYYICLINCQFLAMLIIVLANLSKTLKRTKTFRKLFYLLFVGFSTIITPPDVMSQVCLSSLLIIIYEFLIFLEQVKISMVTN